LNQKIVGRRTFKAHEKSLAAEESGGAEGGRVRRAAADHLEAENVVIELVERGGVARTETDMADTDY
jgi:hypothetical protein